MMKSIQCIVIVFALSFFSEISFGEDRTPDRLQSIRPLLLQDSMNVFRRFEADAETMYHFYGKVLGFEQLATFDLGGNTSVASFQVGDSQVKLSGIVPNRSYRRGEVPDATGKRRIV